MHLSCVLRILRSSWYQIGTAYQYCNNPQAGSADIKNSTQITLSTNQTAGTSQPSSSMTRSAQPLNPIQPSYGNVIKVSYSACSSLPVGLVSRLTTKPVALLWRLSQRVVLLSLCFNVVDYASFISFIFCVHLALLLYYFFSFV